VVEQNQSMRYGKCLIEREIGRGARSIVYLGWHEGLQIPVAVKVMKKEFGRNEAQFSERFTREARIAAQLSHTNIVRVYDCGETDEDYYLILEYVEGESCRDKMEQWGAFDWQRAVQIVRQVGDGLRYAESKSVIHRDLKPENIMIGTDGVAHLADLGLAKDVTVGQPSSTAEGDVLGTPYYMSPEQVRQPSDVCFRSDIYSLGATLYHMATGEVPFEAPTPFEIMTKHLNEPLVRPEERRPDLPEALCDVIVRMMRKLPEDRYNSYDELIEVLDGLLSGDLRTEAEEDDDALLNMFTGDLSAHGDVSSSGAGASTEMYIQGAPAEAGPEDAAQSEPKPEPEPVPKMLRPLRPIELPGTLRTAYVRGLALLGVVLQVATLLALHSAVQNAVAVHVDGAVLPAVIAGAALAAALLVMVLAGWSACLGGKSPDTGDVKALDRRTSTALARLCDRLRLVTPRVRIAHSGDDACRCYRFFSGRATLYVPTEWMHGSGLTEVEVETILAQGLAPVYTGAADMNTLLALPLMILRWERRLMLRLAGVARAMSPGRLLHGMRATIYGGLMVKCTIISVLFAVAFSSTDVPVVVSALGTLVFATLAVVAGFSRQMCYTADALAVVANGDPEIVCSVVVIDGLSGADTGSLLMDLEGTGLAAEWTGEAASTEGRARWRDEIVSHFSETELLPTMTSMVRCLFDHVPSPALRLNALADLPVRHPKLCELSELVRHRYGALLESSEQGHVNLVDLAKGGGFYAAAAMLGAVLTVVGTVLLGPSDENMSGLICGVLVVLVSGILGVFVAPRAIRRGVTAGGTIWAIAATGTYYCCATTLLFALAAHMNEAVMASVLAVPALMMMAGVGALAIRLRSPSGSALPSPVIDLGAKTAHTVMMHMEEDAASLVKEGRRRAQRDSEESKE